MKNLAQALSLIGICLAFFSFCSLPLTLGAVDFSPKNFFSFIFQLFVWVATLCVIGIICALPFYFGYRMSNKKTSSPETLLE